MAFRNIDSEEENWIMNLKESYRYANYLNNLLGSAYIYLQNKGFMTTTKQNHLRSKVNADAADEVVEVKKSYEVEFTPNDVIDFAVKVITEQEALAAAIAIAKVNAAINIDHAVAMNKKKQHFVSVLNSLANIKAGETQSAGKSYKFDINGEQKPYFYDIISTTEIDYNRNDVKNLIKKYSKDCDEVSAKLDEIEITTQIDFVPIFDINDNFEDIVAAK